MRGRQFGGINAFLMTPSLDLAGPLLGMIPQKVTRVQRLLDKGIPYGKVGNRKTGNNLNP